MPLETSIAHVLALGQSLEEAAANSGITIGTARNCLTQIFARLKNLGRRNRCG